MISEASKTTLSEGLVHFDVTDSVHRFSVMKS
jgi:hypothetical protein